MKKLLGIVILGLLLISCSEIKDKKMLENCADEHYERQNGVTPLLSLRLKGKLLNDNYYRHHVKCELEFKKHPKLSHLPGTDNIK